MKSRLFKPFLLASALAFGAALSPTVYAQTTESLCGKLNAVEFNKLTVALNQAKFDSDSAVSNAGYTPSSSYPSALVDEAINRWNVGLGYLSPLATPYVTATNAAFYVDGQLNMGVMEKLQGARGWATGGASIFAINKEISEPYLIARKSIQVAIDQMQLLGNAGARCAVGQFYSSDHLPASN